MTDKVDEVRVIREAVMNDSLLEAQATLKKSKPTADSRQAIGGSSTGLD